MTYKILFAGIDGSGKTTCVDSLISKLSSKYRILKIASSNPPYLFFRNERRPAINHKWQIMVDRMRIIARKCHLYGLFLCLNIFYKYISSKYVETFKDVDIIMYAADTLLHPAVYITYHFPYTKKLSTRFRFIFVKTLFGFKSDFILFYLDTDPHIAMDRIRKRNIEIQPHENCRDLESLRAEFDNILRIASDSGIEIVRINTNNKSVEEVTNEMEIVLKQKFCLTPESAV